MKKKTRDKMKIIMAIFIIIIFIMGFMPVIRLL